MSRQAQLLDIALPVPLDRTFSYRHDPQAAAGGVPARRGDLALVPFGRRRAVIGLVTAAAPLPAGMHEVAGAPLRDVVRILPPPYRLEGARLRLAQWLADYYALPLGEVVPLFHPPAPGTRARAGRPAAEEAYPQVDPSGVVLTAAQRAPVEHCRALLQERAFGAVLLHGVTGSGKTEIYLSVIADALALGRGAIYLLPEIALTPQTLARIAVRFGGAAAAIHSGMSAGQRCLVHEAAARGEVKVVVGPRSALFVPVADLGVVVVDEEHDTSFKQDDKPRYHARHAALVLGRDSKAVVILGSATPDLESVVNARRGRFRAFSLPARMGADLPPVSIVDMRGAAAQDGFTTELLTAVGEALAERRQVLLYYNRRGFARALQCGACGEVAMCPNCDIALTLHLRPRRLLCHYCGTARAVPARCAACGGVEFLPAGGGTQKVEVNLNAHFPEARVLRLDHDTTRARGSHRRILAAFAGGRADVLIGTQMVAKGHHFPGVQLVGVLAADDGLGMPDFRAAERAFQLLTQVAGRAGRTGPGRVIFQTWRPDDPVILAAARHDPAAFLAYEMPQRRALGYPPFGRLVRVGISGRRLAAAEEAAGSLARVLRANLDRPGLAILGPAPGVFPRLLDRHRLQILVKGDLSRQEKAWLAACARSLQETYRGIDVFHDVDPLAVF